MKLAAKNMLFTFAELIAPKPEGIPRNVHRARQVRWQEEEGWLWWYDWLVYRTKVTCPQFAAVNLIHIMPATAGELDICSIAAVVSAGT